MDDGHFLRLDVDRSDESVPLSDFGYADAAKILIDPFLSDDPSWDKGWIGSRAGEDSTQGGVR